MATPRFEKGSIRVLVSMLSDGNFCFFNIPMPNIEKAEESVGLLKLLSEEDPMVEEPHYYIQEYYPKDGWMTHYEREKFLSEKL